MLLSKHENRIVLCHEFKFEPEAIEKGFPKSTSRQLTSATIALYVCFCDEGFPARNWFQTFLTGDIGFHDGMIGMFTSKKQRHLKPIIKAARPENN